MDPLREAMYLRWESRNRWAVTDYHSELLAHLTTNGARELALTFGKDLPKPYDSELLYLQNTKALKRAKVKSKKKIKREAVTLRWIPHFGSNGTWEVCDAEGHLMHYVDKSLAMAHIKEAGLKMGIRKVQSGKRINLITGEVT
jgi:hypothetical protein